MQAICHPRNSANFRDLSHRLRTRCARMVRVRGNGSSMWCGTPRDAMTAHRCNQRRPVAAYSSQAGGTDVGKDALRQVGLRQDRVGTRRYPTSRF